MSVAGEGLIPGIAMFMPMIILLFIVGSVLGLAKSIQYKKKKLIILFAILLGLIVIGMFSIPVTAMVLLYKGI